MSGGRSSLSFTGSRWMEVQNNTVPWPDDAASNITSNWTDPLGPQVESEKTIEGVVMAAIVIGIVATMFLLFSLAIFLDCRNQKLEAANGKAKKSWRPSRKKSRIPVFIANSAANKDAIAFANELCVENRDTTAPTLAHAQETVGDS